MGAGSQPADVWAAGVVLWALIGGGFPFLKPEEEDLGRMGRVRAMAPRIVLGCTRPLPGKVHKRIARWQHLTFRCVSKTQHYHSACLAYRQWQFAKQDDTHV